MSEEQRNLLLKEILTEPNRNAPRRAYAELLLATGESYGEFIQVQLEVDRLDRLPKYDQAVVLLRNREKKLLTTENKQKWAGTISEVASNWTFNRGFVGGITITPEKFVEQAELLFQAAPLVYLELTNSTEAGLEKLAQSPYLARILALSLFDNKINDIALAALLNSPYLSNLRWLNLAYNSLTPAALDLLGATANLPALEWLNLVYNQLEDPTDEPVVDQGDVLYYDTPRSGSALEARYGRKKWLHWRAPDGSHFGPSPFGLLKISD